MTRHAARRSFALPLTLLLLTLPVFAQDCLPFDQAQHHVGTRQCVTGKVLKVSRSPRGLTFLDFCDDYRNCAFTVVIYRDDIDRIGDVTALSGRIIRIQGKIQRYEGCPQIVLRDPEQLMGDAASLPRIPKDYDVERQGKFSAGKFTHPRAKRKSHTRQRGNDTIGDVEAAGPDQ